MKTIQKYPLLAAVLVLLGVAGYYFFQNLVPFDRQKPATGEFPPEIALEDLGGNMVRLSDYRGKVVLVNFWASWCPPCKEELPGFQTVFLAYQDKGFVIIAVSIDDLTPSVVDELGLLFPVVVSNKRVTRDYGNIAHIPASFLIGKDGKIVKKIKGIYDPADLKRDVVGLLAQP